MVSRSTFVTDRVTTKVSARNTDGQYSLMTWVAAPKTGSPPHVHAHYDETFYVLEGQLEFVLRHESVTIGPRDSSVFQPELATRSETTAKRRRRCT